MRNRSAAQITGSQAVLPARGRCPDDERPDGQDGRGEAQQCPEREAAPLTFCPGAPRGRDVYDSDAQHQEGRRVVLNQTPEHADEHQSDANEAEALRPAWFGHRAIVTRHAPAVSECAPPQLSDDTPEWLATLQLVQQIPATPEQEHAGRAIETGRDELSSASRGGRDAERIDRNEQRDDKVSDIPAGGVRALAAELDENVEHACQDCPPEGRDSEQHLASIDAALAAGGLR